MKSLQELLNPKQEKEDVAGETKKEVKIEGENEIKEENLENFDKFVLELGNQQITQNAQNVLDQLIFETLSSSNEEETNNKRSREEEEDVDDDDEDPGSNKRPKFVKLDPKEYLRMAEEFKLPEQPPQVDLARFRNRMRKDDLERLKLKNTLLTDITYLLVLPQKVAAAKLDLSESMLCKRFKEATKRKWPYRALKKIEKNLELTKSKTELSNLIMQRNELLSPISIYVRRYLTQQEVDDDNFAFND